LHTCGARFQHRYVENNLCDLKKSLTGDKEVRNEFFLPIHADFAADTATDQFRKDDKRRRLDTD
jgi:hypothetical protein